jgi:methionyl-tRNA formyltransferase
MRLIFMGTAAFALPSLRAVSEAGHDIGLVITQPDRPAGRGQQVRPPPVKLVAQALHVPILQPATIRDPAVVTALRDARPEVIVVAAYGQLIPHSILELPPRGCLNVHASLLPKYRGPAPIPWAIMNRETVTGVTIMLIERRLDAGPILLQRAEPIRPDDTAGTLGDRLAALGATLLCQALDQVASGTATLTPQDERLATYAPKLGPEDTQLDWSRAADALAAQIRALAPEPGATTRFGGRRVKVLEARPDPAGAVPPGTVLAIDRAQGVLVAAGAGALWLSRVQPESRRAMTGEEFARGYRVHPGSTFGNR